MDNHSTTQPTGEAQQMVSPAEEVAKAFTAFSSALLKAWAKKMQCPNPLPPQEAAENT